MPNHCREICAPESSFRLPVVEQHTRIEGSIDVQVTQLSCSCHFKVQSQNLSMRWVPANSYDVELSI